MTVSDDIPFRLVLYRDYWRFVWMGKVRAKRQTQSNMIFAWCVEQFGKPDAGQWMHVTNFYGIQFDFYRLEMAMAFKMRWYTPA